MSAEAKRGVWSPWGDRLVAVTLFATLLALAGAWVTQYAAPDGGLPLVDRLSYTIVDGTWMPPGATTPHPLWGVHYFGDMWYHIGFGEVQTPYIIPGKPAQYPPVAIYMFKLWGIFGYPIALIIMSVLNVALLSIFAWRSMFATPRARRVVVLIAVVLLTGPMLVTLDRGGHQYITLGVMAWAFWNYSRGRPWTAVVLMVLAVSLKSYAALFLVYPLVRGHWKFAFQTALAAVAVNGLLFFTFPGRAPVSFAGFYVSSRQFSEVAHFDHVYNGSSLTSAIFHLVTLFGGRDTGRELFLEFEKFLSVPGLVWLVLVLVLAASRYVPFWASMTLALASAAMAIPSAWPYAYAPASLAALYFGLRGSDPFPIRSRAWLGQLSIFETGFKSSKKQLQVLRWVIAVMIAAVLAPQFYMITGPTGDSIRGYYLVAPSVTLVGGLFVASWWAFTFMRRSRRSDEISR